MKEDDVRSVFLLALYVLLGPHWNKRPDVTQEPEKGFIGALPLWSVPSGAPLPAHPPDLRALHRAMAEAAATRRGGGEAPALQADLRAHRPASPGRLPRMMTRRPSARQLHPRANCRHGVNRLVLALSRVCRAGAGAASRSPCSLGWASMAAFLFLPGRV